MQADDVFEIIAPAQWTVPLVFNSPHSGTLLPPRFLAQSRLSAKDLRQSQDCFVDELFDGCIAVGAPMLRALLSRSYIDLNREPYELDARMFLEDLPQHCNTGSPRVACGLGTLPRIVAEGQEIYRGRIPVTDAYERVERAYRPYHQALAALVNEAYEATGTILLVDCHSMPSSAVGDPTHRRGKTIEVVIGDRFGSAADPAITTIAESCLRHAGLHVVRNRPYAGGFSTENHGHPQLHRHALQIEINRAIYMDETRQVKSPGFAPLKAVIDQLCGELAEVMSNRSGLTSRAPGAPGALAAE